MRAPKHGTESTIFSEKFEDKKLSRESLILEIQLVVLERNTFAHEEKSQQS